MIIRHKYLTLTQIRDSNGQWTKDHNVIFNWSALWPTRGFRIPTIWAGLQLIVLALVFYSLY